MTGPAGGPAGGSGATGPETLPREALATRAATDRSGATVGSYRLLARVGAAANCDVYLGERSDGLYERRVMLRLLVDPASRQAFAREREALTALDHPGVARFLDAGELPDGTLFVVVEHVDGSPIDSYCDARRLTVEERLSLFLGVTATAHFAHQHFVVHGDLRPEHVLVTGDGVPKIVFFGPLAAGADGRAGPAASGEAPTTASDVLALGALLWTILVGTAPRPPGAASSAAEAAGRVAASIAAARCRTPRSLRRRVAGDLDAILRVALDPGSGTSYLSAMALGRDVERHLAGLPVAARGAGAGYRLSRWARRRRGHVAAGALAVIAVLWLVAWVVADRNEHRRRLRVAQHFGQQGEEMAEVMRLAGLLPRHPIAGARDEVKRRMARLAEEASRLGELAQGPAAYALGRGYLALHDAELARAHLERAWKQGFDGPETALALGTALGALYRSGLAESDRVDKLVERSAARRRAAAAYRDPALVYLRASRHAEREASAYVEGLIAFYDGRLDEALALSRRAAAEAPWLHEARELEAEVLVERAFAEQRRGRYPEARRLYDLAGQVYGDVLAVARSDARAHAQECGRTGRVVRLEQERGTLDAALVDAALRPCEQALEIDPDLVDAYAQAARIRARWADWQLRRGEDPRPGLERLDDLVEAILERQPVSSVGLRLRGDSLLIRARWSWEHGEEPWGALDGAVSAYADATAALPRDAELHSALGNARLAVARFRLARGAGDGQGFEAAAAAYRRAVGLDGEYAGAHSNLGAALLERARAAMAAGEPGEPWIRDALPSLERAIELNPGVAGAYQNLGAAYLALGLDRLQHGLDPLPSLAAADRELRRAAELDPEYFHARHNLAVSAQVQGAFRLKAGLDPAEPLGRSLTLFDEAQTLRPAAAAVSEAGRGLSFLLLARSAVARGRDARAAFAAAEKALDRALAVDPGLVEALAARAELLWHRARSADLRSRRRLVSRGLDVVRRCLELNPDEPRAQAVHGALLVLAARDMAGESRRELAGRAVSALEAGLRGSALWDPDTFAPALDEARALATRPRARL